jgi:2-dehydro-3-deoxy-D-arabinonate dehydratase
MQLIKFAVADDPTPHVGLLSGDGVVPLGSGHRCLSDLLHAQDVEQAVRGLQAAAAPPVAVGSVRLLAPLDDQEVWGAGVTYERSKVAREQESDQAATFYDRVYRAARPELFFKATRSRVVGAGGPIRVRRDSQWCVPEPELALVLSPALSIVGFTIGNDVSARDIEGENPLYLPQAKVYDSCCALGPGITLAGAMPARASIVIRMELERAGIAVFNGETSIARMARPFEDLIDWLGRDNQFPDGVVLLTGTGIVPPDDFSLRGGDIVRIAIDGIGTLVNPVIQGTPTGTR